MCFLSYKGKKKHPALTFNADTMQSVTDAWYSDNVAHMDADEWKDILAGAQPFLIAIAQESQPLSTLPEMTKNGVPSIIMHR
jgi:hypothetical protein